MVRKGKKTLLEKWEIPINHLDFDYVKQCTDSKELERICLILRSGEEGYYPDLTKCTEDRLKCLKPNSKIFRTDTLVLRQGQLDQETSREIRQNLAEFTQSAKQKENDLKKSRNSLDIDYPPVRQPRETSNAGNSRKKSEDRIKSFEYQKWDKYDADAEVLKLDLQEEIQKEQIEREQSQKKKVIIEEIVSPIWGKLTKMEREELALKHKIKGNEYFKTNDFEDAHREYTKCIEINPSAVGFNNRAIANIKLNRFKEAIEDCDECLKLEPKNLKALLRKAQALQLDDCKRSAYEVLQEILEIDPENSSALKSIAKLKQEIPLPPKGAFRMKIEQIPEESEVDLSKLIVPNKIVKSKISTVAQNIGKICGRAPEKRKEGQTTHDKKIDDIVLTPLRAANACESREAFIEEIFD
ncbi:sperm-associated antigen 1 [Phlebotomus papatasi]|uniref:sperm-associated antigen 1 n=1 Tax=Phlebotomus papatasi TaxID=29031 RepID=UPI00248464DF|nr:sperm-associated antigen 1 [Phlebotomus papatasi]